MIYGLRISWTTPASLAPLNSALRTTARAVDTHPGRHSPVAVSVGPPRGLAADPDFFG